VNRLQTAATGGQSFSYNVNPNPWGNMTCSNTGTLPCTPLGFSFNSANNQITSTGYTYDAAGNLLSDNTHGYVYDAENRLTCILGTDGTCTSYNATLYLYDAQGQRVGKQQANTLEDYVYDPQGHISSVHDGLTNLLRTEFYAGGRHVATNSSAGLYWNHADWLGTERVRTNSSGTAVETCTDTPYGMNLGCVTTQGDLSPMHFTGKQHDYESGLDNFGARYYGSSNALGRFMSVDPENVGADSSNPQTWNMYAYAGNNPTTNIDPDGEDWYLLGGATCSTEYVCDEQGYILDESGNRYVVTDQAILSGQAQLGPETDRGIAQITVDGEKFEGEFFNQAPYTLKISGAQANSDDWVYAVAQGVRGARTGVIVGAAVTAPAYFIAAGATIGLSGGGVTLDLGDATAHGAMRMAQLSRLAPTQALETEVNATAQYTQADGAKVFVRDVGGKFNVVIKNQNSNKIVTVLKHLDTQALANLAKNFGWR
jgi:RHS repeat-associated protein